MQIKPYTFTHHTTTFEVARNGHNYTLTIETDHRDDTLPYTNVQKWSRDVFRQEELDALEEFAKANYKIMLLMGGN